ncbi:MAG: BREX system P-loop protein BrxC, partial [Candidatus Binatia bacterium]
LGDGIVWLIGTAQQTLTEDDPRDALNSPELYKLKDRFPVQIDLESRDIKEICYRRLLGKSSAGVKALGTQFDSYGQLLRHNTRLQDARYYDADFTKDTFINLYPFLPAHFDILLHLLGALAKSTGGIGLRSAIKVLQDILVEGTDGDMPVADQPVGYLATTVTLYDALDKDIRRAFPSIHRAVGKVQLRFPETTIHPAVAKTVAILQILDNLPVTLQNVASLLHPSIDASSQFDTVKAAADALIADPYAPFGEQDGELCLFSEKLNDIEQERAQIPPRGVETRRILCDALKEAFAPLPATQLQGSLSVQTGLKVQSGGGTATALAGERNPIQTVVELVEAQDYDTARTRLVDDSRHPSARHTIFLLGRSTPAIDTLVADIYRCQEIVRRYRNEPDQEIKDYSRGQSDRAERLMKDQLQPQLKRSLSQGSFIFRGHPTAVESMDADLSEAGKKYLAGVAQQVFERYAEAPVRAETALAEKFLRVGNLTAVTSAIDPLGLVQVSGGRPSINTAQKALCSVRDYIDHMGTVEGKRLTEHFTEAPFGWSPDTLRYLVAAMLVASELTLKVSGREVTVNGQLAIDALKTNNSFRSIGVSLRAERPSLDVLTRAAERLTDLIGDVIVPLEDEISKATMKYFPQLQHQLAPLAEKFAALSVPGDEQLRELSTRC